MYHPYESKQNLPKNHNGHSKFNNSDNMKSILGSGTDTTTNVKRKDEVKDPKEINRTVFSSDVYKKSMLDHVQSHRKGNIALKDGKVFYLK